MQQSNPIQSNVLMIDNFDSFTFNLVHYLEALGAKVITKRNNEISLKEIVKINPSHIILSPGPGKPENAGICSEIVKSLKGKYPILGVCLGHQVIGQEFGLNVNRAVCVMHGKTSLIYNNSQGIFNGVPKEITATRYHSLVLDKKTNIEQVLITAWCFDEKKEIVMGIEVQNLGLYGVQFHPESIASEHGQTLLSNFLKSKVCI